MFGHSNASFNSDCKDCSYIAPVPKMTNRNFIEIIVLNIFNNQFRLRTLCDKYIDVHH